ncbi:MAG: metallophosphoesterase [Myxococcaceae bacterium]
MDRHTIALLVVGVAVALTTGLALAGSLALVLARLGRRRIAAWEKRVAVGSLAAFGIGVGCFGYGVVFEADWLEVTHHELRTRKLKKGVRLRIVHLTDLHVDGWTPALRTLSAVVNAENPDVVVFTGDSINSREGVPVLQEVLRQMRAPRYAILGNQDVWYWQSVDLFGGGAAIHANGAEPIPVGSGVTLCGADYGVTGRIADCLGQGGSAFKVLAYHTPDLVEELAPRPDLYLAGHTHGGQVRVPLYGAVITLSKFDKRYEMGRYEVEGTTLYVNRGVGFEGGGAPRVRFLCRPEVAVIDLVGTGEK